MSSRPGLRVRSCPDSEDWKTGVRPNIGVGAGLEPKRVNVVDQVFHPVRKADRVYYQFTGCIAPWSNALLNQNVLVAKVAHSSHHKGIRLFTNCLIVVVAEKMVPIRPAHGRRGGEARFGMRCLATCGRGVNEHETSHQRKAGNTGARKAPGDRDRVRHGASSLWGAAFAARPVIQELMTSFSFCLECIWLC